MLQWLFGQANPSAPSDWLYQLGAFGVALAVAWWLLGRSDRQLKEERVDAALEAARLEALLVAEREAHEATRLLLYEALRRQGDPES